MADKKTYLVGFLTIVILASGIVYINLDDLKIRVDNSQTTFYTLNENNRFVVSGREINSIFDGTSKMNRNRSEIIINTTIEGNITTIIRNTPYLRRALIRDTYTFRGDIKDIEQFPVSHKIEVINGDICGEKGCIYNYQIRDLIYTGETKKLNVNEMSFGRNMKVEWDNNFYYAKIYKYKGQDKGKLTIKYRIKKDYEVFYNRLFDPVSSNTTLYLDLVSSDRYYEHGTICELKANVTNSTGDIISHANLEKDQEDSASYVAWGTHNIANPTYAYNENWNDYLAMSGLFDGWVNVTENVSFSSYYFSANWTNKFEFAGAGTSNYAKGYCWNYTSNSWSGELFSYASPTYFGTFTTEDVIPLECLSDNLLRTKVKLWKINSEVRYYEGKIDFVGYSVCLNIDQVDYGDDFICGNGSVSYNLTTNAVKNKFNDSTTSKNLTIVDGTYDIENANYSSGDWLGAQPYSKAIDENLATYAGCPASGDCTIIENITINQSLSRTWRFKIYSNTSFGGLVDIDCYNYTSGSYVGMYLDSKTGLVTLEETIPDDCVNVDIVRIKTRIFNTGGTQSTNYYEGQVNTTNEFAKAYINFNKYDEIQNAYIDLTGYENTSYPYNAKIYIDDTEVDSIEGTMGSGNWTLTELSNDNTAENLTFYGESTKTRYLKLGQSANVTSAYLDVKSYYLLDYDEDNSQDCSYACDEDWVSTYTVKGGYGMYLYIYNYTSLSYNTVSALGTLGGVTESFLINESNWISGREIKLKYGLALQTSAETYLYETYYIPDSFDISSRNVTIKYEIIEGPPAYSRITEAKIAGLNSTLLDSYIDVGNSGSPNEWTWSGNFTEANGTQTANLNHTLINSYLSSCSPTDGYCNVPILLFSNASGTLEISNIEINYTLSSESTRDISASTIQTYLDSQSSGFHNVPIKISSESNTIIQIDNINITYYGSDNISVTAHFDGDGTYSASNDTQIIKVQYSDFEISLPSLYPSTDLVWMPAGLSSKNVTPWGQTSTIPAYNISHLNYDQNMNISIKLNESLNSCINLTVSSNSSKSSGFILNTSYQDVSTDISLGTYSSMFFWADLYSCNRTAYAYFYPTFYLRGCCKDCVKCS